ncbi:MAG: hypothetical protein SH809_12145 [Rhodothermales bacterium]|nr:hypothetical protein [Rhodothermales bacterium]
MHNPPRVKICCISSIKEAHLAIDHGAGAGVAHAQWPRRHPGRTHRRDRGRGASALAVEPFGLDLCSRVREDGKLNARKLEAFMRAVR